MSKSGFITAKLNPPAAFWSGAVAILTQTLLFRELSNILRSNELILGLVLSIWLLSAGAGALFGFRRINSSITFRALLISCAFSINWIGILANILAPTIGLVWPFDKVLLLIILSVSPFGFLVGAVFRNLSEKGQSTSAHTYIFEGLGSLFGGILSLFVASTIRPDIALPAFSAFAIALADLEEFGRRPRIRRLIFAFALLAVSPSLILLNSHLSSRLKGAESVKRFESRLGAIEVVQNEGQTEIYRGGIYLGSSGDSLALEDVFHALMVTCPKSANIAIFGGILQGSARIAGLYEPNRITVPVDDWKFFRVAHANFISFRRLENERIDVIFEEPRRAIRSLPKGLDLIFISISLPSSITDGRISTEQAIKGLSERLSADGRIAIAMPLSPNLPNPEELRFLSSLLGAVRKSFPSAKIYLVEGFALLIAPDGGDFERRLCSGDFHEPRSTTVNQTMISHSIEQFRQTELEARLESLLTPPNSDSKPVAYTIGLRLWERFAGGFIIRELSAIGFKHWVIIALLFIAVGFAIKIFFSAEGVFSALSILGLGWFGMGLAIIILYRFQISQGWLYTAMGLLSSLFILGGVVGARLFENRKVSAGIWLFVLLALVPPIWAILYFDLGRFSTPIFAAAMLLAGLVSGSFYSLSLRMAYSKGIWGYRAPAFVYGLDLIGASASATLVGVAMIPHLGIERTLLIMIFFVIFALTRVIGFRNL